MTANLPSAVIAAATDSCYALPLAVMLRSALVNLNPEVGIEAHIVDDGLSLAERNKVEASLPAHVGLHWIRRSRAEFDGLPNWGRMSLTTYHKLTLGEWLPSRVKRVIWLDADMLVLGDLAQLWEADLGCHLALAAQDILVPYVSSRFGIAAHRELGLTRQARYFNAGVMLIDVAQWRRDEVGARAFDYLRRYHERVFFWDQEALNAVLAGRWEALDPRWNWNPLIDRLSAHNRARDETTCDPWIIHFVGNLKPWTYLGSSRNQMLYYQWLDQTAWRGWRPKQSWRSRFLAAYESSRLRALVYPLEQLHLRLVRLMTRNRNGWQL
ncbi:MAG TPA: glycosyltransferase family 8 protein [Chthoniobacterales bacterium]|nr:glycosyltransferase family 8 protein [Chthoniobacterales bacterium]